MMVKNKRRKKTETSPIVYIIAIFIVFSIMSSTNKPATFVSPSAESYAWYTGHNDRSSYDNIQFTPTVTIGEYTITAHKSSYDEGPPWVWGCYQKYTVSKDGVSLGTTEYTRRLIVDMDNDVLYGSISEMEDEDSNYLFINQGMALWDGTTYQCYMTQNTVQRTFRSDAFDIEMQLPDTSYFAGEYVPIDVSVINNQKEDFLGVLKITYDMTTFFGDVQEVQTQDIIINQGENTYQYVIPTEKVVERFNVSASISIKYPAGALSPQFVGDIDRVIGSFTFPPQTISLNPLPLTMIPENDGTCIEGYSLNPLGDICVADYVFDLSCYHIGCPKVEGTEYQCTSAGICAETVYVTVYGECPDGTTEALSDLGEKICIKTEIFESVMQCKKNSDCMNPCDGVAGFCEEGMCVYQGECSTKTEKEIVEIIQEKSEQEIIKESAKASNDAPAPGIPAPIQQPKSNEQKAILIYVFGFVLIYYGIDYFKKRKSG